MPPSAPQKVTIPKGHQHADLIARVREALIAAPAYFKSEIRIIGVPATDIQNLNTLLGAAIEERVVDTLNGMRTVWDSTGAYALYNFVRQPQTFPDVLLRRASDNDVIMGIELKGWYLLAKEEEPSFRFVVTPAVCNPQDLMVVYPWHHVVCERETEKAIMVVFDREHPKRRRSVLWVRETWAAEEATKDKSSLSIQYAATPEKKCRGRIVARPPLFSLKRPVQGAVGDEDGAWRPSIHMPRWASRISLRVTGVRAERLQDISEADAKAEGVDGTIPPLTPEQVLPRFFGERDAVLRDVPFRFKYSCLWDSINGAGSWDADPWVWVVGFDLVKPQRAEVGHAHSP